MFQAPASSPPPAPAPSAAPEQPGEFTRYFQSSLGSGSFEEKGTRAPTPVPAGPPPAGRSTARRVYAPVPDAGALRRPAVSRQRRYACLRDTLHAFAAATGECPGRAERVHPYDPGVSAAPGRDQAAAGPSTGRPEACRSGWAYRAVRIFGRAGDRAGSLLRTPTLTRSPSDPTPIGPGQMLPRSEGVSDGSWIHRIVRCASAWASERSTSCWPASLHPGWTRSATAWTCSSSSSSWASASRRAYSRRRCRPRSWPPSGSWGLLSSEASRPSLRYAPVLLYPIRHLHIVSDRWTNPDGSHFTPPDDIVYPALTKNTYRFLSMLPPEPCRRFLDLGSGTGVAALAAASSYAGHAWAVDITERSTRFAEFNRLLNGVENVTVLQGDLYEPVGDLDLRPDRGPSALRAGGHAEGGFSRMRARRARRSREGVVGGLPAHLSPGGRFYCLALGADRQGRTVREQDSRVARRARIGIRRVGGRDRDAHAGADRVRSRC